MTLAQMLTGRRILVFGRNGTVGTSWENLNEYAGLCDQDTIFSTAAAVDVSSSSTSDTAAGTGARTITVYGLDSDWELQTETITLNGQTKVAGTATWKRVFGVEVTTHGTGKVNAGDIHMVKTGTGGTYSGGVPGTLTSALVKMPAGAGMTMGCWYTTPAGIAVRVRSLDIGTHTQAAVFGLWTRDNGHATNNTARLGPLFQVAAGAGRVIDLVAEGFENLVLPEKTDVELRVAGAAASAVVHGMIILERTPRT